PGHIPRPKNAFMCYRSWFYENKPPPPTADGKKLNQQVLSKQVAITWNSMTPEEQAPFHEMAKQEKKAHELKYPSYSYSP
ncbi:high mobility group box domain-containing protein, partial [Coprinopsis sp. MPI-PUGE-AT-0042]